MFKPLRTTLLCLALGAGAIVHAAPPAQPASPEQLVAALNFQQGKITLPGDIATLDRPASATSVRPTPAACWSRAGAIRPATTRWA